MRQKHAADITTPPRLVMSRFAKPGSGLPRVFRRSGIAIGALILKCQISESQRVKCLPPIRAIALSKYSEAFVQGCSSPTPS